ncbi:SDR family oxidoreductase [Alkalihalobacillus sp. AL-G]|uniref:SDR family oxidoreductase n=1 Tax=Alkalihalobacillus sp. AL-G TaxID=2926399 RepID=UPI00272A60F2|nr:SDR family oxidoreductase [Alkalihalobacillus sp. AL-G]WLD93831.1 SDR family oxidoreductase [Alkalihalobacillus sp. AL-G]
MKVLVIGANGQVGKQLVELLGKSEHEVTAMVRDTDQIPTMEKLSAKTVTGNLEKDFSHAVAGADAVIFTAGSGAHTGYDKTILIDQEGAIKAMDTAKSLGVKRFIMLSSIIPKRLADAPESMKPYYAAKNRADEYLKGTNLDYTIVRPGRLTNEPGSGKIDAAVSLGYKSSIPRADVAHVLFETLEQENTYSKTFEILSGDDSISKALRNV